MSTTSNDVPTNTSSPAPIARPLITLDQTGDVRLIIGADDDQQSVMVRRAAMSLASPVWEAMFARQWSETTADEIAFPDDDIEAMLIILRIAHLRFYDLPQSRALSRDQLLNLAVTCDKYDTAKLVKPFLDLHQWAIPFVPSTYYQSNCHYHWLFIAWVFGWNKSLENLARYLVQHIKLDDAQKPTHSSQSINPDYMPPQLLGK
jgi:hypothetical protein